MKFIYVIYKLQPDNSSSTRDISTVSLNNMYRITTSDPTAEYETISFLIFGTLMG